jgi:hypothetical protein
MAVFGARIPLVKGHSRTLAQSAIIYPEAVG